MQPVASRSIRSGFLVALVVCALLLWPVPYDELNLLEGAQPRVALMAVAGIALVVRGFMSAPLLATTLGVGVAAPVAVLGKIVLDLVGDSSRHNLAGIEIMIAMLAGVAAAGAGALIGSVPTLLRRMQPPA